MKEYEFTETDLFLQTQYVVWLKECHQKMKIQKKHIKNYIIH